MAALLPAASPEQKPESEQQSSGIQHGGSCCFSWPQSARQHPAQDGGRALMNQKTARQAGQDPTNVRDQILTLIQLTWAEPLSVPRGPCWRSYRLALSSARRPHPGLRKTSLAVAPLSGLFSSEAKTWQGDTETNPERQAMERPLNC